MSTYKKDNYTEFYKMMVNLSGIFPAIINESRLRYYYRAVSFLPEDAFIYIESIILDNHRIMPLPEDFKKIANDWKRNNPIRFEKTIDIETYNLCSDCEDTGYIYCQINQNSPKVFMYCYCEKGEYNEKFLSKDSFTPRWIKNKMEIVFGFIKHKFPKQDYIPLKKDKIDSLDNIFSSSLLEKWKNNLNSSREYWKKMKDL